MNRRPGLKFAIPILAAIVFSLFACSKREAPTATMSIEVARAGPDWAVTWRSSASVAGLEFRRRGQGFRAGSWRVESPPGAVWRVRDGVELLVAQERVNEFKVVFGDRDQVPLGDYPFLRMFSDGGAAIFASHVLAKPFNCNSARCPDSSRLEVNLQSTIVSLRPSDGESLRTASADSNGELRLEARNAGWIYFGKTQPTDFGSFRALFDKKLPSWIRKEVESRLPRLLSHFESRLGLPLGEKPLILFPYSDEGGGDLGRSSGAVAGSQILLSLEGGAWRKRSAELNEDLLKLLAHEAFHLWNASSYYSVDRPGGAWLHEGAAEALSLRALTDLELLPRPRASQLKSQAFNRCMVARDLRSDVINDPLTPYHCGAAIHVLIEGSGRTSLYEFWAYLFRASESRNRVYTHEMFHEAVAARIGRDVGEPIRALTGPDGDADKLFSDALTALGAQFHALESGFPVWYKEMLGETTAELLLAKDCPGRQATTASVSGSSIYIRGSELCARAQSDVAVEAIEGLLAVDQGVEAYDHVRDICSARAEDEISLRHAYGSLSLKCVPMPRRPAYLWIQSFPSF